MVDSVFSNKGEGQVKLFFKYPIINNEPYSLLMIVLPDECGNSNNSIIYEFSKEKLSNGDLLINELLFNTYSGGADFIELYNNSMRDIDVSAWHLPQGMIH
jgi:hypothetical protein